MNHELHQGAGTKLQTQEGEFLYFGGTSYLGLQYHTEFQEKIISGIRKWGTNFGASRKANIKLSVFQEFENLIAHRLQAEEAICVSSGYLAGQMLTQYFSIQQIPQFCAPHTHPALIGKDSVKTENFQDLESKMVKNGNRKCVLFLDSIDFDGNNFPDFTWLFKLDLKNVILVVDDSHGLGLLGDDGFGLPDFLQKFSPGELIICASLGKALATPCGIIAANTERIEALRNFSFYGGGSPPSPAALQGFMQAEILCREQLQILRKNIDQFQKEVVSDFQAISMPQYPVFTYDDEALTRYLYSEKIITTNFHYPLPDSPLLSKIVLSAAHTSQEIRKLTDAINSFYCS
ncbi:MAG: aminotransferase class I/II-fold pyridoxal phosphate-dependent enzyme [Christiangramia sp.]